MKRRTKNNIWRLVKLTAFTGAIIWVITLGGVNAGKTMGVLIVMTVLMIYLVTKDTRKYMDQKNSLLKAIHLSTKENVRYWFK